MAPEQVAGEAVDGRADVYALGCVLYEMLTGERAFDGSSSVIVMGKQLRETPLPPRAKAQGLAIPASLEEVVMRAMAKEPSRRWPSARDMRQALERTLAAPEKRRIRLRRALAAVTMATCTVVAAGASAQWARTHALAFEAAPSPSSPAPLPSAATSLAMASLPGPAEAPSTAPAPLALASVSAMPAPGLRDARSSARARPGDPRALETWARAALRAGELREARRAVNAWILRDGTVEPRLFLSSVLEGMGRKAEARTVLAEWLESHPDSGDARLELARLSGEASGQLARK
jgi:serine/threonine-protein kinase